MTELDTSQGCAEKQNTVVGGKPRCLDPYPSSHLGKCLKPSEPVTFCVPHVTIVLVGINPPLLPYVLTAFDLTCMALSKEEGEKLLDTQREN